VFLRPAVLYSTVQQGLLSLIDANVADEGTSLKWSLRKLHWPRATIRKLDMPESPAFAADLAPCESAFTNAPTLPASLVALVPPRDRLPVVLWLSTGREWSLRRQKWIIPDRGYNPEVGRTPR
jgi:hypothetical protein